MAGPIGEREGNAVAGAFVAVVLVAPFWVWVCWQVFR